VAANPRRGIITALITSGPLILLTIIAVYFWREYHAKDRIIAEQKQVIRDLGIKLDRAWAEELVADVRVDAMEKDTAGQPVMVLHFVQYRAGTEVPAFSRELRLPGSEFYIDALVVKFERELVEAGDGLRGKSMLLFRRAFGDRQNPADGISLIRGDGASPVPQEMQLHVAAPGRYEEELWAQFWELANDPTRAASRGVRVAQGEAPHMKAVPGQVYKLTLRASGGLDITPRLPAAVVGARAVPDAGAAVTH
jgi:hypothetical protein